MKKGRKTDEDSDGITTDYGKISSDTYSSMSNSEESYVNAQVVVVSFRIYAHVFVIYTEFISI